MVAYSRSMINQQPRLLVHDFIHIWIRTESFLWLALVHPLRKVLAHLIQVLLMQKTFSPHLFRPLYLLILFKHCLINFAQLQLPCLHSHKFTKFTISSFDFFFNCFIVRDLLKGVFFSYRPCFYQWYPTLICFITRLLSAGCNCAWGSIKSNRFCLVRRLRHFFCWKCTKHEGWFV